MMDRPVKAVPRPATIALLLLFAAARALPAATANFSIQFIEPEHYADAEFDGRGPQARERALKQIRAHLEGLAERHLEPGQTLRIDVLDVDLAGRFEPWHLPLSDVRYLREVTWPKMKLQYELREGETTILSAKENVSDQNYLMRPQLRMSTDPLKYDKAMLDDWFRSRFAAKK